MQPPLDVSLPALNLRVGPGLLPLAVTLSVVWDMACHSHKADVCLNCQKETKTTLWEVEGWVKKKEKLPSFINKKTERLNDTELYTYDVKCDVKHAGVQFWINVHL